MNTTMDELAGVIRDMFEYEELVITPETTASDVEGWDSLSNALVIRAVELHFHVTFTPKEIFLFKNVGEIAACIQARK